MGTGSTRRVIEMMREQDCQNQAWDVQEETEVTATRTTLMTGLLLISMMLTAGVRIVPQLPLMIGLGPALCVILFVLGISIISGRVLHQTWHLWNRAYHGHFKLTSYADLGRVSSGGLAAGIFQALILGLLTGLGGAIMNVVREEVRALAKGDWFAKHQYQVNIPLLCVLIIFVLARDCFTLYLSPLAAGSGLACCLTICYKASIDIGQLPTEQVTERLFDDPRVWPKIGLDGLCPIGGAMSLVLGLLGVHHLIPPLMAGMHKREDFLCLWVVVQALVAALFAAMAVLSWAAWGTSLRSELPSTMYGSSLHTLERDPLGFFFSVASIVNMTLVYPIVQVFLFDSMYAFEWFRKGAPPGSCRAKLARVVMLLVNVAVAWLVGSTTIIVQGFAATVVPALAIMIPMYASYHIRRSVFPDEMEVKKESAVEIVVIALVVFAAAFCFVGGVVNCLMLSIFGEFYWEGHSADKW